MAGNAQLLKLEKKYDIVGTRKVSDEIIALEVSDPESTERAIFWLKKDDYEVLGLPTVVHKCTVTIEIK